MSSDEDRLARAARRAAGASALFIAPLVQRWSNAFGTKPEEALGCGRGALAELSLCLRPRPDRWIDDVRDISSATRIDTDLLVAFLRAAEAVERFSIAHPSTDDEAQDRLLAARDRDDEP